MPRRRPTVALAACAVILLGAAAYSIVTPTWHSPDEQAHVDLAYQLSEHWDYPPWNETYYTRAVLRRSDPRLLPRPAALAPLRGDRQSFGDAGGATLTGAHNHISQHPPLYYALAAVGLASARELTSGDPFGSAQMTVGLLRLGNALLVAGIPLLTWFAARRAGASTGLAALASIVPIMLPGYLQIGGAVNNDNLLPLAVGLATWGFAAILDGDRRPRTVLGAGTALALALAAKATAVAFVVPAVLVALVVLRRHGWRAGAGVLGGLAAPVVVLTGWWYGPKVLREGKLSPSVLPEQRVDGVGAADPTLSQDGWRWFKRFIDSTTDTFVGRAGVLEVRLPSWIVVTTVLVLTAALVAGLVIRRSRVDGDDPTQPGRLVLAVLLSGFVTLYVLQAIKSYGSYNPETRSAGLLHGRYLYSAIVPFSIVVARGLWVTLARVRRWLPLGVLALAAVVQTISLVESIDRFWGVDDGLEVADLRALVGWSAWHPVITVAIIGGAAAASLGLVLVVARAAIAPRP